MLDRFAIQLIRPPLTRIAQSVNQFKITANQITLIGFMIGLLAVPALMTQQYLLALILILINRFMDGLDGAIARLQGISDAGGFLDICLDFLFYAAIPFGFIWAEPAQNALAGGLLLCSFIGTGSSFLAFAIMANKQGISDPVYQHKSLYYMTGLTEGTETIACFILMCLLPQYFAMIASVFAFLCLFTTISRIYHGFQTLKANEDRAQV